jgi:hypothetical protein
VLQQSMPHMVIDSLALIARLPGDLAHRRRRHEGPTGEGLGMLVLHVGGLRE